MPIPSIYLQQAEEERRRQQPTLPGTVELPTAPQPESPAPFSNGADLANLIGGDNPPVQPGQGWIDGIGATVGESRSTTPDRARSLYDAGVSQFGREAVDSFLSRNPNDYERIQTGLASERTGDGPDAQGFDPNVMSAIARAQSGQGGGGWPGQGGLNMPGGQFDDPYTKLFEDTAKQYLERLTGQNAEMDRLMKFIGDQFAELSTSQGYSPDEQAVLRTQALEPIERDRTALNQRVLERTSARGFLPSSGLNELDLRDVDRDAEERRTVAQRDLAVNAIGKRQADRGQALNLAQLGLQIPNQQGQQAMSVANSLYQLPRNALMDSLQVLNSSSPQSAISPMIQLQQQQQQQAQYQQQQTAAMWQQIGQILAGLM